MDFYQQNMQQSYTPYTPPKPNTFATLSLVLGIASLALLCTGIFPIPLGALGILFAILSRRGKKLEGSAIGGCISSAIGLGLGLIMTIMVYVMMIFGAVNSIMENPESLSADPDVLTDQLMESIYGEDYKEIFEQYGIDYDEMMEQMNGIYEY